MIYRILSSVLCACALLALASVGASAHPHVWVTVRSELVYAPDGSVTGVRHAWTFDDMFSVFATPCIKAKKQGEFTREELAPLAEVNVGSLKEYDYFTYAKDITIEVYDREFFVDFSFAEKDPVKLVGAPGRCKVSVLNPQDMDASLAQKLSQLGADQRDPALTIGSEYANKIVVKCP